VKVIESNTGKGAKWRKEQASVHLSFVGSKRKSIVPFNF
jgi:hypothetical protein